MTQTTIQLSFFDAILDLLMPGPLYAASLILIGILLFLFFRKDKGLPRFRTAFGSLLLYYYLGIVFRNVVGIPTIKEFIRLDSLGESIFNPIVNWIPFADGISFDFILNILCFIPFGFLCPLISGTYKQLKKVIFLGFLLSLLIEVSQMFTLYRATDINDLITNVLGTAAGYLCFRLVVKLRTAITGKAYTDSAASDSSRFLPPLITLLAFIIIFMI
ncbi:VanZ family protein [[Clostridium] hylemonae]|uniref:VanZ family protein n=1 Tax=[Clostridium] hylemonae TaxID=89153 RepID=UPI001D07962F|nr:VanZ family protein [[Clostridium] hylemonae]MCB7523192.1 VanZ family protein [[Clostridium] hylemonae]